MRDTPHMPALLSTHRSTPPRGVEETPLGGAGRKGAIAAMVLFAAALSAAGTARAQSAWTQLAGQATKVAISPSGPKALAQPSWIVSTDQAGNVITFAGQSSPVVSRDLIVATGKIGPPNARIHKLVAIDRRKGAVVWTRTIAAPQLESFSAPAIDERNSVCMVASGSVVAAFDLSTGEPRWTAPLAHPVVNASIVIADGPLCRRRAFITDYDGYGIDARLYCINLDPQAGNLNPFTPGEIVWSAPIGGASGASPAYAQGHVYVATVGEFGVTGGVVMCFDALATQTPDPLWTSANPLDIGYFGGLCVSGDAVFAASYSFFGGTSSSNLVKLSAKDGTPLWSVPCNRSASIPIPLPPRPGQSEPRVLLSGGLSGFGTRPTLQLFTDHGSSASLDWESSTATWFDANGNGNIDPGEYLSVGGWSHQPVVSTISGLRAFVGTLSAAAGSGTGTACTMLTQIDLNTLPAAGGFIVSQATGCGSSPALADSNLYTIGALGLYAFGPTPPQFDVDGDGQVNIEDLYAWEQGWGHRDVDQNGKVETHDRDILITELRRGER